MLPVRLFSVTLAADVILDMCMRVIWLSLWCLCCTLPVAAAVELEKTMKEMAFQYKQAAEIQNTAQLIPVLDELILLTGQALQAKFAEDKAEQFRQGLQRVLSELQLARVAAQHNDLPAVQSHLRQVEALRKQYHKLRKVSFWQLLFG